jgi:ATP-dependent Clp protease, protease subunit
MLLQEPSRKIIISSEINESVAKEVIERIMEINDFDHERSEMLKDYKPAPIEIFINSVGGHVTDGFAIIGAMQMSETPIITYGLGLVASMALAIFVAGDVRLAHRYCRFMYHSISYGMVGHITEHEAMREEVDLLQRMYNSLMLERTKFTRGQLEKIRKDKQDFYFSAKQAIELGVADKIIQAPEKKF